MLVGFLGVLPPNPPCSTHLDEENGPHFAPGLGLGQGIVAGQVAALHGQGVMHHTEDEDAH